MEKVLQKDYRDTDVVVLFMGQTKAGRSTLINILSGSEDDCKPMEVGTGLTSATTTTNAIAIYDPPSDWSSLNRMLKRGEGRRIVLVDTPGFDSVRINDDVATLSITQRLENSKKEGARIGCVIYLHDITDPRWSNAADRSFKLFRDLCRREAIGKAAILTTKWTKLADVEDGIRRVKELVQDKWGELDGTNFSNTCGLFVRHLWPFETPSAPGGSETTHRQSLPGVVDSGWAVIQDLVAPTRWEEWQGQEHDFILFVIGGDAAGKSTFINHVLNEVGHPPVTSTGGVRMEVRDDADLSEKSDIIRAVRLKARHGKLRRVLSRVVLVEVPSLADNAVHKHEKIVSDTTEWLSEFYPYPMNRRLGIIYVQDITIYPLESMATTVNLKVPVSLAKRVDCTSILVVTTKWDRMSPDQVNIAEKTVSSWPKIVRAHRKVHKIEKNQDGREGPSALAAVEHFTKVSQGGPGGDVVIFIMGETKSGKTTFINRLLAGAVEKVTEGEMRTDAGLNACTKAVTPAVVLVTPNEALNQAFEGRRFVFVDTPGFNNADPDICNRNVLSMVVEWLTQSYSRNSVVGGVVYLHDITREGWTRSCQSNLDLLTRFWGEYAMEQVSIVSTRWDKMSGRIEEGYTRLNQLKNEFWNPVVKRGASVRILEPTSPSNAIAGSIPPWDVVSSLALAMKHCAVLDLQAPRIVALRNEALGAKGGELGTPLERWRKTVRALMNSHPP